MFCDIKCLLCDQDQTSKINYSFYHGVCNFHKSNLNPIISCHYCSSYVPVNKIIDISKCNNCSNITIRNSSPCGHILCENCEKECFLCKNKTIDLYESGLFRQQVIEESPKVQTLVSEGYSSENPEIIHLSSSISIKICQYCRNKIACNLWTCNHYLCDECLTEGKCKLCELLINEYLERQEMAKSGKNIEKSELDDFAIPNLYAKKESEGKNVSDNHAYNSSAEVFIVTDSLLGNLNMENTFGIPKQEKILEYNKPKNIDKIELLCSAEDNKTEEISHEINDSITPSKYDYEFKDSQTSSKAMGSTKVYPDEPFFTNDKNLSQTDNFKNISKPRRDNYKDSLISKDSENESYNIECIEVHDLNENASSIKLIDAADSTSNSKNSSFNTKKDTPQPPAIVNEEEDDEKCCCTLF